MTEPTALDAIDQRLRSLPANLALKPDDDRAVAHLQAITIQHESQRRSPLRVATALGVAALLIVLGNLGAAYFAPRYGHALADVPLVGPISSQLLHAAGLNDRSLTVVNDVSVSSGHTLRLVAAYADGLRTVLFVQVDGRGLTGNPKKYGTHPGDYGVGYDGLTLTDQFGHRYGGGGVGGPTGISFEPLTGLAAKLGGRLTLHVTRLNGYWTIPKQVVEGNWTLHATLVAEPGYTLTLPTPIRTADVVYTFTSIQATSTVIDIHYTIAGPGVDQMEQLSRIQPGPAAPPNVAAAHAYAVTRATLPRLFDSTGREMQVEMAGITYSRPAVGEMIVFIAGPGRYQLEISGALTSPNDQRWIVVP